MGVAVGSLGIPGSTGNFGVSGLAFQPVAVIFWNQYNHLDPHSMMFGCATSSTEQWATWIGTDTESSGYVRRKSEGRTDACAFQINVATDATRWRASMVSLDATGFTLNLDVRNDVGAGEGSNIFYMALGGDHITEAHAGTVTMGGSTGTVSVTAPGFRPTSLIMAHNTGSFDNTILQFANLGVGVTDGAAQFSSYALVIQETAVDMRHIYRSDAVSCFWNGTNRWVIEFDSWTDNGFVVDVTEAFADVTHGYLAINAEAAVAGFDVQPDADTTLTYDTPGLIPGGVFFCWPGADTPSTTGTSASPLRPGVGGGTLTQQRLSAGIARSSAPFGVWTSDAYQLADQPMGFWGVGDGIAGNSNQSQASTVISATNEDSFDLEWTEVQDTNDRVFGWLAFPGELSFMPQIYRIIRVPHVA